MPNFQATNNTSRPDGPRRVGECFQDGRLVRGLIEWTQAPPDTVKSFLEILAQKLPTKQKRPEEACSLQFETLFHDGQNTALIYKCDQQPTDLHDALTRIAKPDGDDRRALSLVIATKVRSLYVHFDVQHTALRPESFVFFSNGEELDFTKPYILDWARPASPGMHQDPEYRPDSPLWSNQVWALMMLLSEIAEWKPLSKTFRDETDLRNQKLERKRVVMDPEWRGPKAAQVFRYGFAVLEKDYDTLKRYTKWDVKRFYDELCELLAPE